MVYVVIPVHNRVQITLKCLQHLAAQTELAIHTIVIDDGSTDGTSEQIKKIFPAVTILQGNGNLWWGGAMRWGIDYALQLATDQDYILSLNDDVTFAPDYVATLVRISQKYQAVVGSLCVDYFDHSIFCDTGITIDWKNYNYRQKKMLPGSEVTTDVDTVSGRGVLFPVPVLKQIGNIDPRLSHYGADYEIGFRVRRASIPIVISNQAIVYLRDDLTGFRPDNQKVLTYQQYWKLIFSKRSPRNIWVSSYIILKHCPGSLYKARLFAYWILGSTFLLCKNFVLYTLQLWKSSKS